MEDALARKDAEVKNFEKAVLILVVMEDALAHVCKDAEVKNFEKS